jgi:hypothetical protein
MGRRPRVLLTLTASLGLIGAYLASASAFAGPDAGTARKCNKYKERKVGKVCKKRSTPPVGDYHSADGNVEVTLYSRGGKTFMTADIDIPVANFTCTMGGPPTHPDYAKISSIAVAKHFQGSGPSANGRGPAEVSGDFLSALKVKITGTLKAADITQKRGETCSGSATYTATLVPGRFRGRR